MERYAALLLPLGLVPPAACGRVGWTTRTRRAVITGVGDQMNSGGDAVPLEGWSTASVRYEIRR